MVIRRGPSRFLAPLAFYLAASACVAYFIYHAHNGPRGLETRQELTVQIAELAAELEHLLFGLLQGRGIDRVGIGCDIHRVGLVPDRGGDGAGLVVVLAPQGVEEER